MTRFVDQIRERDTEIIDVAAFWQLVQRMIESGAVIGFTPSPRCETDAERATTEAIHARVDAAIRKGRRDAGLG